MLKAVATQLSWCKDGRSKENVPFDNKNKWHFFHVLKYKNEHFPCFSGIIETFLKFWEKVVETTTYISCSRKQCVSIYNLTRTDNFFYLLNIPFYTIGMQLSDFWCILQIINFVFSSQKSITTQNCSKKIFFLAMMMNFIPCCYNSNFHITHSPKICHKEDNK